MYANFRPSGFNSSALKGHIACSNWYSSIRTSPFSVASLSFWWTGVFCFKTSSLFLLPTIYIFLSSFFLNVIFVDKNRSNGTLGKGILLEGRMCNTLNCKGDDDFYEEGRYWSHPMA